MTGEIAGPSSTAVAAARAAGCLAVSAQGAFAATMRGSNTKRFGSLSSIFALTQCRKPVTN
jgi:hypothetical protein